MKLHEYLKQFEGLDPEIEVYKFYQTDETDLVKTFVSWNTISVNSVDQNYCNFTYTPAPLFRIKAIVLP